MADKRRKKNSPDSKSQSQKQPILPLLIMILAALLVGAVAFGVLHPPTRLKIASGVSKTKHIIEIIKDDGSQPPKADEADKSGGGAEAARKNQSAPAASSRNGGGARRPTPSSPPPRTPP
ncbi:hypothetical protein R80B4_02599 [Fibrobacteres bacterium R8-0-B4]